jgi:glycine/D-amino acid oxidase-like deaminating enzyme
MGMTQQSVLPASVWAATAIKAPAYHPVASSRTTDVAVVGAGYTGLSTALHLARAGVETTVVEASEPGWGASGRNGGQIIAGLKLNPDELDVLFGLKLGSAMVETMGAGASLVASLIEAYKIDCHPIYSGWIQAAHGQKAYNEIVVPRATQWAKRGVRTDLLNQQQIAAAIGSPPSLYVGGWHDSRGGVLQPLSYARGLAAAAISEGATIHACAPVRRLRRERERWVLEFDNSTITANNVVLATNAYTDDLWPGLRQTVVPVTSFQIATYPLDKAIRDSIIPGGQGITDTRRLLLYFRQDHEGRLIMGGRCPVEDNPTMMDASALRATIAKTFPQAAQAPIQFLWSGKVALTKDSLPHIHLLAPNLYTALGCNGRGVAACTTLGKIMAQFVSGTAAEELPLPVSAPDQFALHALRKVGVLMMSQYYRLLDRLEAR